jgi:hypothetical protein
VADSSISATFADVITQFRDEIPANMVTGFCSALQELCRMSGDD